ncbi:RES family NAD+ phosphorylase [Plebeiibacterium sediminum]|uniref:RES family NAD+ phosphorylase n=1 Tax=Plebeiibacterium sediminum TaxID=2992112 RepID=A0AAE3SGQ1_9BACT|nr:RES family NAD+ phosphorylase [Plebeiobacterium sediminum]MCW3788342.1 RES family NAD+ phosphorylase [Plebeiobacterium sediminum]
MASTLKVFRICKTKFSTELKGSGAFYCGGRWNSIGNFVLYTSSSVSLSMLEVLVHVSVETWPDDMSLVTIIIPAGSVEELDVNSLLDQWRKLPSSEYAQKIGDKWIEDNNSLVLKVPSVLNPKEYNYLINPNHTLCTKIKIESIIPWSFDPRFKKE